MPDSHSEQLGRLAVERGLITATELREGLEEYRRRVDGGEVSDLGEVLVDLGALSSEELKILGWKPPTAQREPVRKRLGNFDILKSLGTGGMGSVYLARQVSMDRLVALKVLKPVLAEDRDFVKRFLREARLAGKLDHPNLVRAIDVGELGKSYYLAMEYVEGPVLLDILKEKKILPEAEALKYILDIARALECAHKHAIIHRDIKPANVLIDSKGTAKLTDLGLAKQVSTETQLTQTGVTMGSPDYVSPEQAGGEREVDIRGDIYSLGITLFHLVTGQTPFTGPSAIAVMTKHLTEKVPWAGDIKADLSRNTCRLIARMTARNPEDRYQNPTELMADLESVIAGRNPENALASPRAATAATIPMSPDARTVRRAGPPSPAVPTATPLPEKPPEAKKGRWKRWGINCLAIFGAIFLFLILVGMCTARQRERNRNKTPEEKPEPAPTKPGGEETGAKKPGTIPEKAPAPQPITIHHKGNIARAIPADAMLSVISSPPARWKDFREKSPVGRMWQQPQIRAYFKPMVAAGGDWLKSAKDALSRETDGVLRIEEFEDAAEGELGMALVGFKRPAEGAAGQEKTPLLLFLAQTGGRNEKFQGVLDKIRDRLKQAHSKGRIKKPELRSAAMYGTDATLLEVGGKIQGGWSFHQGCFIFALELDALKRGLQCIAGRERPMPLQVLPDRGDSHLLTVTLNVKQLLEIEGRKPGGKKTVRSLKAVGLGGTGRLTYLLKLDAGQFRESVRLETGPPAGLLRIPVLSKPVTRESLRMAPGDSVGFFTARLPAGQLLPILRQFVLRRDAIDGSKSSGQLKTFIKGLGLWGLDLEKLLDEGLTGGVALSAGPPDRFGGPPSTVLIAGVRNRELAGQLVQMLGRSALHSRREAEVKRKLGPKAAWKGPGTYEARVEKLLEPYAGEILKHRAKPVDYQGTELYIMEKPEGSPVQLSAVLTRNRLILGLTPAAAKKAVKVIIKKEVGSLDGNAKCKALWERLPPNPQAMFYIDAPRAMDHYGGLLFLALYAGGPAQIKGRVAPPAKLFSPHLAPGASALYAKPDELRLEIIANVPRGLPFLWMIIEDQLKKPEAPPK